MGCRHSLALSQGLLIIYGPLPEAKPGRDDVKPFQSNCSPSWKCILLYVHWCRSAVLFRPQPRARIQPSWTTPVSPTVAVVKRFEYEFDTTAGSTYTSPTSPPSLISFKHGSTRPSLSHLPDPNHSNYRQQSWLRCELQGVKEPRHRVGIRSRVGVGLGVASHPARA
jgi:hypothetical protein